MYKRIAVIAAAVMTAFSAQVSAEYNKYNEEDCINLYNFTIQEVAESFGMTVDEFKTEYGLPEDMPGDTNETAAYYTLTIENFAKVQGITAEELIAEFKNVLGDGTEITGDTLYKDAEDKIPLKSYLGEMTLEDFKNSFGFDDTVTEETPFGTVRTKLHRTILSYMGSLSYFEEDDILVMLNGKYLDFDVAPVIMNDRAMVPMRSIFEALGSVVNWDAETKTIFANKGSDIITMQVGQNVLFKNMEKIELDTPSVIVDERTLVPLRAVAEALDTEVFYNANTKTVVIH